MVNQPTLTSKGVVLFYGKTESDLKRKLTQRLKALEERLDEEL